MQQPRELGWTTAAQFDLGYMETRFKQLQMSQDSLTQVELLLVLQPGKPGLEVLVAEGALEGPILGVEDHVLLQVRPPSEGL